MRVRCSTGAGALALILGLGLVVVPAASRADEAAPASSIASPKDGSESAVAPKVAPATLTLVNRPIMRFRAPSFGVLPEQRAERARERIAAELTGGGDTTVTTEKVPQGTVVKLGGQVMFLVNDGDAAGQGPRGIELIAQDAARALERAIDETREARDVRHLLSASAWALGATVVFLVILWLLRAGLRRVTIALMRVADRRGRGLKIGDTEVIERGGLIHAIRYAVTLFGWLIALLLTYQWLGFVLSRFPFTRAWSEQLGNFLEDTSFGLVLAIVDSIPGLLIAVVIFVIARWATTLLRRFFDAVQEGRTRVAWLDADIVRPTRKLVIIAAWIFAVAMAYPYIPGSGTDAFKGLSVLLGLMVSIGASGIVGQAASGLILMYTRTFRPGEYVRIGDHEGTVVAIGMFTTRIRTGLGEELTLPNSMVMGTVTYNYSRAVRGPGFVVSTAATIGYEAPWRQVHAMLIEAARRTQGVLSDPPPRVVQTALSDYYVEYRLVCQAEPGEARQRAEVISALHQNTQDVFNENGVQIMSPHYMVDPEKPKVVPPARWYEAPAEKPPRDKP